MQGSGDTGGHQERVLPLHSTRRARKRTEPVSPVVSMLAAHWDHLGSLKKKKSQVVSDLRLVKSESLGGKGSGGGGRGQRVLALDIIFKAFQVMLIYSQVWEPLSHCIWIDSLIPRLDRNVHDCTK